MPGPAPRLMPTSLRFASVPAASDIAELNAQCESCHAAIAAEWRQSMHRQAHVDPVYQRALAIEPLPFCRACHVPDADPSREPPARVGVLGISCVTCHVSGSHILAAPLSGASEPPAPEEHAVTRDPRFASVAACARCHEFEFPDRVLRAEPEWMQRTVAEHALSAFTVAPCATCHMPLVITAAERHRSHRFQQGRDEEILRRSVAIAAKRLDAARIQLTLSPRNVGHAVPTGDLFRRLELSAEVGGEDHVLLARQTRHLARHFRSRMVASTALKTVARDDRPGGMDHGQRPVVITLDLGEPAQGRPIHWRLVYQRVEHPLTGHNDEHAVVASEILIANGEVAP